MRVPKPSDRSRVPRPIGRPTERPVSEGNETTREIYAVVRAIPRGRIATYGQIAELAGLRAGHRLVARAMRSCPKSLPWQRVVAKKDARRARIAIEDPEHAAHQRRLLEAEGVRLDDGGCIALREFGWLPADAPKSRRRQ